MPGHPQDAMASADERIAALEARLRDSEETLEAIRRNEIDALVVVGTADEPRVFTLEGADRTYRVLVEQMQEGAVTLGEDGTILYCNQSIASLLGDRPERVVGRKLERYVLPEEVGYFARLFREARETGSRGEVTLRTADGRDVPVHLSLSLLHDNATTLLCGVLTDLTEQKLHLQELTRTNLALAIAEAQFRALFDSQFQYVILLATDGTVLVANRTALEAGGLSSGDVVGRAFGDTGWWPPAEGERLRAEIAEAARGALIRRQVEVRGADGRRIWIDFSLKPVEDPATGRVEWLIAEGRDLTEHRLAEHLERAREEAERATRAKSRFLSGMSHELRTPLNGILGYAQLLRLEGGLSVAQSARVDAMLDAGGHLLQVINRVLDVSKIETERVDLQSAEIDLCGVASTCLDLVRPPAESKGLALDLDVAPNVQRHVTTDSTRLRQVLVNLLGNAVKFTSRGSVTLRVRTVAGGGGLRFDVADTGPGIPVEQRHRLFREFERLNAGGTATVEGAGLGLALSARLAAQMGGSLGHEENPEGGSVFWLEIPLTAATAGTPPLSEARAPDPRDDQPAAAPMRALRVLVVDDAAMNRDIATAFLRTAGYEVTCAEGGAAAVAAVAAEDFDIVLMDVGMPEVDGLEATRRIRALAGARGQVPVLALTAHVFADQIEECRKAGMDGHLAKPFIRDTLLATIAREVAAGQRRTLSRPAPQDSAPPATAPPPALGSEMPVVNTAALERIGAFLKPDVIEAHLRTVAQRAAALLCELGAPDAHAGGGGALAAAAHTLAGSSGMLGFDRLAFEARCFEHAVRTGAATSAVTDGLTAALEATIQAIDSRTPVAAAP